MLKKLSKIDQKLCSKFVTKIRAKNIPKISPISSQNGARTEGQRGVSVRPSEPLRITWWQNRLNAFKVRAELDFGTKKLDFGTKKRAQETPKWLQNGLIFSKFDQI